MHVHHGRLEEDGWVRGGEGGGEGGWRGKGEEKGKRQEIRPGKL